MFGDLPSYGLYVRHAADIDLRGVTLEAPADEQRAGNRCRRCGGTPPRLGADIVVAERCARRFGRRIGTGDPHHRATKHRLADNQALARGTANAVNSSVKQS